MFFSRLLVGLLLVSARVLSAWTLTSLPHSITDGAARPRSRQRRLVASVFPLQLSSSSSSSENADELREDLLVKASRLRQEANDLETKLRQNRPKPQYQLPLVVEPVRDMKDSTWTFSYRFSETPDDDSSNNNDNTAAGAPVIQRKTFFSGRITLRFRADGYTDVLSHEPTGANAPVSVVKAWGWDLETSNDDEKEYLQFSVDMKMPPPSSSSANINSDDMNAEKQQQPPQQQRFYFQSRLESNASGVLSLKEGTITIKQDLVASKSKPWGLFSPGGILAQFRYVGDFAVRNK